MSFFSFMRDTMTHGPESGASSKRLVLIMAGFTMSISVIILSAAAVLGYPVEMALWAVTTPLAAMAGASYVTKKESPRGAAYNLDQDKGE